MMNHGIFAHVTRERSMPPEGARLWPNLRASLGPPILKFGAQIGRTRQHSCPPANALHMCGGNLIPSPSRSPRVENLSNGTLARNNSLGDSRSTPQLIRPPLHFLRVPNPRVVERQTSSVTPTHSAATAPAPRPPVSAVHTPAGPSSAYHPAAHARISTVQRPLPTTQDLSHLVAATHTSRGSVTGPTLKTAPALNSAPAVHAVPAVHPAPAVHTTPAVHTAPAVHTTPAVRTTPTVQTAPAAHTAPAVDAALAVKTAPAVHAATVVSGPPVGPISPATSVAPDAHSVPQNWTVPVRSAQMDPQVQRALAAAVAQTQQECGEMDKTRGVLTNFRREMEKASQIAQKADEPSTIETVTPVKRRDSVPPPSRLRHPEARVGSKTPDGTSSALARASARATIGADSRGSTASGDAHSGPRAKRAPVASTARRRKKSPGGSVNPAPATPVREEILERRCRELRAQAESLRQQFESNQRQIALEKEKFLKEKEQWNKDKSQNVREIANLKRESYAARQEAHESKASLILKNRELLDNQAALTQAKQQIKELEQQVQLIQQKNQTLLAEAAARNAETSNGVPAQNNAEGNSLEKRHSGDANGLVVHEGNGFGPREGVSTTVNGRQFVPVAVEQVEMVVAPTAQRLDVVAEEPEKEEEAENEEARAHAKTEEAQGHADTENIEEPRDEPRESLIDDSMESQWVFVIQGQNEPSQQEDFERKKHSYCPSDALEKVKERGIVWVCERGRRQEQNVPNQDDFLLALQLIPGAKKSRAWDSNGVNAMQVFTQVALYGVFDGHGPNGHKCSDFARTYLPESVFGHKLLFNQPEIALQEAFHTVHMAMLEQSFDCTVSGTTAALAMVMQVPSGGPDALETQSWLICAHAGDSRLLLASVENDDQGIQRATITQISSDHRPEDEREESRINQSVSGEVRVIDAAGKKRIFAKGSSSPALALTRSLGDSGASDLGVTWEPDVVAYRLRPCDKALILATDGLFEFCGNEEVASILLSEGMEVLPLLCQEARRRWAEQSSNQTVDDITAIGVPLDVS